MAARASRGCVAPVAVWSLLLGLRQLLFVTKTAEPALAFPASGQGGR